MNKCKTMVHPSETPTQAYERCMRYRMYRYAARIARDHGLSKQKMIYAAYMAFMRFEDLGSEKDANGVAEEFGLGTHDVIMAPASAPRAWFSPGSNAIN